MNKKNNELLSEYQKGYIHCLCNVIRLGCKKVSDDLDDLLQLDPPDANEAELRQAIANIASQYDVKLYAYPSTQEIRTDTSIVKIKSDGTREKLKPTEGNKYIIEITSFILYKNEEDLKRLLELMKNRKTDAAYHRKMGWLFGYGKKEIDDFVKNIRT